MADNTTNLSVEDLPSYVKVPKDTIIGENLATDDTSIVVSAFAGVVNAQENPNMVQKNPWTKMSHALTDDLNYSAHSNFTMDKTCKKYETVKTTTKKGTTTEKKCTKWEYTYNHPQVVTGHEYGFNIPSNAVIKQIRFRVALQTKDGITVEAPYGVFCIYGSSWKSKFDEGLKSGSTGWHDGIYVVNNTKKLSSEWKTFDYVMYPDDVNKGGFTSTEMNATKMGIDLRFKDGKFDGDKTVSKKVNLGYIKCFVRYEVPQHKLSIDVPSQVHQVGRASKCRIYYKNQSIAGDGNQTITIKKPYATDIVHKGHKGGSVTVDNDGNILWTIDTKGNSEYYIDLELTGHKSGVTVLEYGNSVVGNYKAKFELNMNPLEMSFSDVYVAVKGEVHQGHESCSIVTANGHADTEFVGYSFNLDGTLKSVRFIKEQSSKNVELSNITLENHPETTILNIPYGEDYIATFEVCYIPTSSGSSEITVSTFVDDGEPSEVVVEQPVQVLPPYTYKGLVNHDTIRFNVHRVISSLEAGSVVVPCRSKERDNTMYMSPCRLKLHKVDGIDYIGCVELEQTHFDPQSTYKDTLIDNHYKNKRYMGKKLASDEDITLNVRLHPHQVTTIQGLIDMDKPVPINTNHKTFEGNALNHRGWAEIYGIKTKQTGNNPHWYECDIDVKYLTHNLNTRFNIIKSITNNDYKVPYIFQEVVSSGDRLTGGFNDEDYFIVDTDGAYSYESDDPTNGIYFDDKFRNSFTLDNSQSLTIKSKNVLSNVCDITLNWSSELLSELNENNVSRIIKLVDKNNPNKSYFEYEYTNFEYDTTEEVRNVLIDEVESEQTVTVLESVTCDVITRLLDTEMYVIGGETDIDLMPMINTSESDFDDEDDDIDDEIMTRYGSSLHLVLNGNKLSIAESGFSGREYSDEFTLEGSEYQLLVEWRNNNQDSEDTDIWSWFDFTVNETMLESVYASKYESMYISPFPIRDKDLLFLRHGEEGTIYYYDDDGTNEFSFIVEPYYQYMNGTDLVTSDGISIFNLNYGYKIVYIQNGLVRLGFNRLNGMMFLGKYDAQSDSYITTNVLKLDKFDDINIKSISDDKIEIQASDCIFTIWRGHPYIMVNHEMEDLLISNNVYRVWAEGVGDEIMDYPLYWDLMNTNNLLPNCASDMVDADCVSLVEEEVDSREDTTLEWLDFPSTILYNQNITFTLDNDNTFDETNGITILINGQEVDVVNSLSFTKKFTNSGEYSIEAVYEGDSTHNPSFTTIQRFKIEQPSDDNNDLVSEYKLIFVDSTIKNLTYGDGKLVEFQLLYGGVGVTNKSYEIQTPSNVITVENRANGIGSFKNTSYNAGTYTVGAYFVQGGTRICDCSKKITINKRPTEIVVDEQRLLILKGGQFKFKLRTNDKKDMKNTSVVAYVNGKPQKIKTNKYGNAFIKAPKAGTYKIKVEYKGSTNYKSCSKTWTAKAIKENEQ